MNKVRFIMKDNFYQKTKLFDLLAYNSFMVRVENTPKQTNKN